MAATKTKSKGLGNPALIAAASSGAGQEAISTSIGSTVRMAEKSVNTIGTVVKVLLVLAGGYVLYTIVDKRYKKVGQNSAWPAPNITEGQARAKANAIYEAMYGIGADFEAVKTQLAGLNYNAWVMVQNEFGKRGGLNPLGADMDIVEWLTDQFSNSQLDELRFLIGTVF